MVISITGAANVTFKNDNLATTATATEDCSQSININVPSMQATVEQAIRQLAGTHVDSGNSLTTLSTTVSNSMTRDVVQKAISDAMDSFKISLKATGNVDVANFNVSQVATSNLNNIIQNMAMTTSDGQPSDSLVANVQKQLDAATKNAPACPAETQGPGQGVHYASYIGLVVILMLLVVSFVVLSPSIKN